MTVPADNFDQLYELAEILPSDANLFQCMVKNLPVDYDSKRLDATTINKIIDTTKRETIILGECSSLIIWDIITNDIRASHSHIIGEINNLVLSPNHEYVAAYGNVCRLTEFNTKTWEEGKDARKKRSSWWYDNKIIAMTYSPNGTCMFIVNNEPCLYRYEIASGKTDTRISFVVLMIIIKQHTSKILEMNDITAICYHVQYDDD